MPIIRYFFFVGGLLLALLFAAERYLPAPLGRALVADPDRNHHPDQLGAKSSGEDRIRHASASRRAEDHAGRSDP